ncbi:MAG: ATP-dependent DNA helicase [Lachnospiraceae bacterium]|nr:ATP-dependent DNA helicase [Lachnospiraceae bacterium]
MFLVKGNSLRINVRTLVEFVLRSGDLDLRKGGGVSPQAMQEGTRIHQKLQKHRREEFSDYAPETAFSEEFPIEEVSVLLEGRADGVFTDTDGVICIEEIKGMYSDVQRMEEPVPVHLAQAVCYAKMKADEDGLSAARIMMTYVNLDSEECHPFRFDFTEEELNAAFDKIMERFRPWVLRVVRHREERNLSLAKLPFPYPYRAGQKDVVVSVYKAIRMQKNLFIEAPTGIGKTLSTMYPAVCSMGQGLGEKVFYLTAKTTTRGVAGEAATLLQKAGMKAGAIILTAKEKICMSEGVCDPEHCPFAKGHFDRVLDATYELVMNEEMITPEILKEYAEKHMVCPFELGLDASLWVDVIIGDYNHVFDPRAKLARYFGEEVSKGDYLFLIDEAHNLVERARDMYSAEISLHALQEAKKHYREFSPLLSRDVQAVIRRMERLRTECGSFAEVGVNEAESAAAEIGKIYTDLLRYEEAHPYFSDPEGAEFRFLWRDYLDVFESVLEDGEDYRIYAKEQEGDFILRMYCVSPAWNLKQYLDKGNTAIFFSATFLPMRYYKEVLTGHNEDYAIYVPSPFDTGRRMLLFAEDVTTKYTRRNRSEYEKITEYLKKIVTARYGNYLAFVPSFAYLEALWEVIDERFEADDVPVEVILQEPSMGEKLRGEFLEMFREERKDHSLLGICVLGGVFSEGIDLTGEQLIGVAVIGNGLPMVCPERDLLRDYYDGQGLNGFDYAYRFPGLNKVLQSAGRLIRTESDEGVIALLEERFLSRDYEGLYPKEWEEGSRVIRLEELDGVLDYFWKNRSRSEGS